MFRAFLVLFLTLAIAGGVAYNQGLLNEWLPKDVLPVPAAPGPKAEAELGELLYPAQPAPEPLKPAQRANSYLAVESYVVAPHKQDVSSQKDGKLLVVGMVVESYLVAPAKLDASTQKDGKQDGTSPKTANQMVVTQIMKDIAPLASLPKRPLRTFEIPIGEGKTVVYKVYPWVEGDRVASGQIVAMVDPTLAIIEVQSKKTKIKMAEAELEEASGIYKEMDKKVAELEKLAGSMSGSKVVTNQELQEARIGKVKYQGEIKTKDAAIDVAKAETAQAETVFSQHFLRNDVPGASRIKKIFKTEGEGLKSQDAVLQLYNIDALRIEGSVDSQYYAHLREHPNAQCYLEPSVEIGPTRDLLKVHLDEVTGVAVCADGEHFVSGSKDKTVRVWKRGLYSPLATLQHKSPVRSVVCSPKGALLAVGCADGTITLWNLLQKDSQPLLFKDQHQGNVTALAFSPEGTYLASGGEDNAIILWNTATGEVQYPFDAEHGVDDPPQGTVTSLSFTPQCKLVAAANDNALRVWSLHKEGAKLEVGPVANRGGTVGQLGVSSDGRYMLFDKGRRLQLLNVADGATISVLDNLGANPFDTLALFSPNGNLMLTGGAGEGRLHLWKTPTPEDRGYQVRELVVKDRSPISAAAFAPANHRFAVTGTLEGSVQFWDLPEEAEVVNHRIFVDNNKQALGLDLIEPALEGNKSRVAVNVLNPQERLMPGQRVTLVVLLPQPEK